MNFNDMLDDNVYLSACAKDWQGQMTTRSLNNLQVVNHPAAPHDRTRVTRYPISIWEMIVSIL